MQKKRFYSFFFIANGVMLALFLGLLLVSGATGGFYSPAHHPAVFWGGALVNLLLVSGVWMILDFVILMWFRRKYKKEKQ